MNQAFIAFSNHALSRVMSRYAPGVYDSITLSHPVERKGDRTSLS